MQRDCSPRAEALVGGSIGTFDDSVRRLARGNGDSRACSPTRSGAARPALLLSRPGARRLARFPGFAETLGATLGGARVRARRARRARAATWARSTRVPRRARPARASGTATASGATPPTASRGDLDAWDGRPSTRTGSRTSPARSGRSIEALAGRADVTVSLPYEPGRLAFAALERTAATSRGIAAGRIEELPPASHRYARPALAHLERRLFVDERAGCRAARGRRALPRGGGRAWGARARRRRDPRAAPRRHRRPRIAVVAPSLERWRAPLETAFSGLGIPYAIEGQMRLARRRSAARCSRCSASPGSAAGATTSTRSCARRTRVSAATTSTSSRGGCAGAPFSTPERVEEETLQAARPAAAVPRHARSGALEPRRGRRRSPTRCCRRRTASAALRVGGRGAARPRGVRGDRRDASRSWTAWQALAGHVRRRGRRVRARARGASARRRRPGSRAASPCSTCSVRARGTTRSSSCSASRRERFHGVAGRRPCSTTTPGASSRSGRDAPALRDRIRSPPIDTSSTRRARGPRAGSTSPARPPRTTARRASRARSGRT